LRKGEERAVDPSADGNDRVSPSMRAALEFCGQYSPYSDGFKTHR